LKENGTIWIYGTHHNIFAIANLLTELGYKILKSKFVSLGKARRMEINQLGIKQTYISKISDLSYIQSSEYANDKQEYGQDLPF